MVWVNSDSFFIGFETGSRITKLTSGKSFLKPLFSRFFGFCICCHIVLCLSKIKNDGNVILFVSNQSSQIESVDIKILIDGREIVSDVFTSGNFHNYKEYSLKLSPILLYEIEVVSEKAQVKFYLKLLSEDVLQKQLQIWQVKLLLRMVGMEHQM